MVAGPAFTSQSVLPPLGTIDTPFFPFRSGVFSPNPPTRFQRDSRRKPNSTSLFIVWREKRENILCLIRLPLAVVGKREKEKRSDGLLYGGSCVCASIRSLNETILVNWDRPCFFISPFLGFLFLFPPSISSGPYGKSKCHTPYHLKSGFLPFGSARKSS